MSASDWLLILGALVGALILLVRAMRNWGRRVALVRLRCRRRARSVQACIRLTFKFWLCNRLPVSKQTCRLSVHI
jgi:hypothetical protein